MVGETETQAKIQEHESKQRGDMTVLSVMASPKTNLAQTADLKSQVNDETKDMRPRESPSPHAPAPDAK